MCGVGVLVEVVVMVMVEEVGCPVFGECWWVDEKGGCV